MHSLVKGGRVWQEVHHYISSSEVRGGVREKLRTPGSWGKGNASQIKTAWRRSGGSEAE